MSNDSRNPKPTKTKYPGIYAKGNRYLVRYRHRGKQTSRSFERLSEARRFKAEVDTGESRPGRQPFSEYADRWIENYRGRTSRGFSEETRGQYRRSLDHFAKPFFRNTPLDEIDPPEIRRFITHLDNKLGAPKSVTANFAPVRAMFGTAFDDGALRMNPALGVRVAVVDRREITPLFPTPDQTIALLAEIPERYADHVYVLAATGLRISEVLNLKWSALTLVDGSPTLRVRKSKTAAGVRTLKLSPETMRRLVVRRSQVELAGDDDYVFATRVGTAMTRHNFYKWFNPAAERAGVPWMTPHKLRHGMATMMLEAGVTLPELANHLGHGDGGVLAMRTYLHPQAVDVDFVDSRLTSKDAG